MSFHQPEGKVPAETARELATAAILLEQTNTLLDRVGERKPPRPVDDEKAASDAAPLDVRDEKIPQLIGDGDMSPQRVADHLAAIKSQKPLRKAQTWLWDAEHLLDVLSVY
ncbi:MAG TPA: hypothetical protein VFY27_06110, partial [Woeseiaceae bacterium]|nr:hypothetical protein [Woeseiaceae bacterium]